MQQQQGYWIGDKFYTLGEDQANEVQNTAIVASDLKQIAGVDAQRKLVKLMPDGTWRLVQDNERLAPGRYDNVPSYVFG
ncbi:MAG: hypothetical protein ACUVS2_10300 [Candidatus Flexifilum sp.]|jgi:hypothetical protein